MGLLLGLGREKGQDDDEQIKFQENITECFTQKYLFNGGVSFDIVYNDQV